MPARPGAPGFGLRLGGAKHRRATGAAGEAATARWYEAAGYEVLDRNWRGRDGELDLVVRNDRVLVFCEVKTRTSDRFGAPIEAVNAAKQRRIRLLARAWMQERNSVARHTRFDIASVLPGRDGALVVEVIEGCF